MSISFRCPDCHSYYVTNIGMGMLSCEYCGINFPNPFCDEEEDYDEDDDYNYDHDFL